MHVWCKLGVLLLLGTVMDTLAAKIVPVITAKSSFTYLNKDTCTYDDQTNAVTTTKYGVFQNVKKVCGGAQPQGSQLIGSIKQDDGSLCDLYAMTPQQAIQDTKSLLDTINAAAAILFNPTEPNPKGSPIPNPYALESLNAAAVDSLYGAQGLNVDTTLLQYVKNFYFYLEYVVKLEYAARLATLAGTVGIDCGNLS